MLTKPLRTVRVFGEFASTVGAVRHATRAAVRAGAVHVPPYLAAFVMAELFGLLLGRLHNRRAAVETRVGRSCGRFSALRRDAEAPAVGADGRSTNARGGLYFGERCAVLAHSGYFTALFFQHGKAPDSMQID